MKKSITIINIKIISIVVSLLAIQAKATYYRISIVKEPNVNPTVKNPVASIDGEEGKNYVMVYKGQTFRGKEPPSVVIPIRITGGEAIPGGGGLGRGFKLKTQPISAEEAVLAKPVNTEPHPPLNKEQYAQRTSGQVTDGPVWRKWW
ncbi:hypothetical protein MCOR02_008010 [Pyricularia oryzae]|nr:hypothetical protein MCOR02_008010 [Pyricularia oryzae]